VGRAESPTYGQSSSGPFVSQTAYAYGSGSQQGRVWNALARPKLVRCVAQALLAGSGGGVHFTVTGRQTLGLPALPANARGYRVSGTATTTGQTVNVFLDMILLGRGQTISALSISTFQVPVASRLELRLAGAAARRLG